jgi:hypothetical protein
MDVITFAHFLIGMIGVVFTGGYGYILSNRSGNAGLETRIQCILLPVIGSLLGYNYMALGFPGSKAILFSMGVFAGLPLAIASGIVFLIVARIRCMKLDESA